MEPTEKMTAPSGIASQPIAATSQAAVAAGLDRAAELQHAGELSEAATELERAMTTARATPYEIEFQTRIRLGIAMADAYALLDRIPDARALLKDEVAFAEKISQIMQATGTPQQKRMATSGFLQIRDRATLLISCADAGFVVRRDDHDGKTRSSLVERALHVETGETRHLQIEDDTVGSLDQPGLQEFVAGSKAFRSVSGSPKQPDHSPANEFFIVYHCN